MYRTKIPKLIMCKFLSIFEGIILSVNILKYKAPVIPMILIRNEIKVINNILR